MELARTVWPVVGALVLLKKNGERDREREGGSQIRVRICYDLWRSLRSNVRKSSKILYSLCPLCNYLWFEQCTKSQSSINPNIFKKQNFKKCQSIAIFGQFAKAIVRQNGRFRELSSDQLTRWSARMLRKLARVNDVNTVIYSLDPTQLI